MSRRYGRNQRRRARERIAELETELAQAKARSVALLAEKHILLDRIEQAEDRSAPVIAGNETEVSVIDALRKECLERMRLKAPAEFKPVDELCDQAKLALARVAGVPIQMDVVDGMLTQSATFTISDSGRGGYIVGWVNARDELLTIELGPK